MANARAKAEQADQAALKAEQDSDTARLKAKQFAPEFHQPGILSKSRSLPLSKMKMSSHNLDYDFGKNDHMFN